MAWPTRVLRRAMPTRTRGPGGASLPNMVPGPKGPVTSLFPMYTTHASACRLARSGAMSRMTWELMAVTAALTTSTWRPGNRALSNVSRVRGNPTAGSGSPMAADSPRTTTRMERGGRWTGTASGWGVRPISGGMNRHVKRGFSVHMFVPRALLWRRNPVGSPMPASLRAASMPPSTSTEPSVAARSRKTARRAGDAAGDAVPSLDAMGGIEHGPVPGGEPSGEPSSGGRSGAMEWVAAPRSKTLNRI